MGKHRRAGKVGTGKRGTENFQLRKQGVVPRGVREPEKGGKKKKNESTLRGPDERELCAGEWGNGQNQAYDRGKKRRR